jgi:hypothetical protein
VMMVIGVGLGLAAVQMIPAAELTRYSIRSPSAEAFSFFTRWSMHPSYVMTFLFPRLAETLGRISLPFPVAVGYIGILGLFSAILSIFLIRNRHVLFFWILLLISLLLALGGHTPLYLLFYRFLPGFDAFRNPIFFTYLYVFSASVLSGFGISLVKDRILALGERRLRKVVQVLIAGSLLLIITAALVVVVTSHHLIRPPDGENDIVGKIWKYRDTLIYDFGTIGLALLLAGLPLVLRKKITSRGRIFTITLVCIVFLDLMGYGTRFIQTYDLAPFVAKEKYVDFLKKEAAPFRVLPILDYPEQDAVLKLHKISSVNGYGSLEIRQDYQDFIAAFQTEPVTQEATILRIANYDSTAVNLLNAKYILTHNKIEDGRFPLVFSDEIPAAKTWDPYRKTGRCCQGLSSFTPRKSSPSGSKFSRP